MVTGASTADLGGILDPIKRTLAWATTASGWLAGRGAGLVTLAKPPSFNWPGYWLAALGQPGPSASADDATAVLMFGTPSGVVLSPQNPSLLGRAATDLPIREGYVLCGLDPVFIAPTSPLPLLSGTVAAMAATT